MSQTTITLLFLAFAVISFILEKIPLGLTASILSNTGTAAALGGNLSIIGAPGNLMQPRPRADIRLPLLGSTRYCTAPPFAISAPARRNTMVTRPKHRGIAIENVS